MHDNGCQGVLRERHYDGMWYRRVGTWLHYMEKTYQKWLHEVNLSYHILGLRHALIQKGLQPRAQAPHNTACSLPLAKQTCTTRIITGRTRASPDSPSDPRSLCRYTQGRNISNYFFVNIDLCPR